MRRIAGPLLLGLYLGLAPGCYLLRPTYKDVSPKVLDMIAQRIGTDVDTMLADHQDKLKKELSEELGMKVSDIHVEVIKAGEKVETLGTAMSETDALLEVLRENFGSSMAEITKAVEDMPSGSTIEETLERIGQTVEGLPEELGSSMEGFGDWANKTEEIMEAKLDAHGNALRDIRTVVAEIQPATTEAVGKLMKEGLEDPTEPTNWFRGGLAAGGVLLAGALGMRGRQQRKKNGQVAKKPEGGSNAENIA